MSKHITLIDRLQEQARRQPQKVAFTFLADGETESDCLTYQQLDRQARAIAAVLQTHNAEGERALLLYQPGLEFITAFLGCLYGGVVPVPAYPPRANRSISRLLAIVKDARAKFSLTTQDLQDKIETKFLEEAPQQKLKFLATDTLETDFAADWYRPDLTSDYLAFLQYTSGSTGTPKGVMVSHGNLMANSLSIHRCFETDAQTRLVTWLPPYHDMGLIGSLIQPMYAGSSMYIMAPVAFLQRPFRWLQAISRYRASISGGPNFAYDLCVEQTKPEQRDSLDLSCWKLAFSGAEPVRAETINRFIEYFASCGFSRSAFYPCYGMAESTLLITGGARAEQPIIKEFDKKALEQDRAITSQNPIDTTTLVSSGRNVPEQTIIIVNPQTLTERQDGEIGEIWVKSDSVARGYWHRQEQTENSFKARLANTSNNDDTSGFLRTGDLGFLQDGELFVTGRLKDLIIIRGRNYYPQDIELTADRSHEALRPGASAAFAVEIDGSEKLVITQEVKRTYLRKLNPQEVTRAIRQAVSEQHELNPHAIVLLKTGSIPKTSSGKIQRHACKAGFLDGTLNVVGEYTATHSSVVDRTKTSFIAQNSLVVDSPQANTKQIEIEQWLVNNLAERLGLTRQEIDLNEPFASYGLNSVEAVRLSAELEDWLEIKLQPTLAYDYPSIALLSAYLAQNRDSTSQTSTSQLQTSTVKLDTQIAIVGMSCRFPGAKNLREFWELLRDGKDAITRGDRWGGDTWGGFIEDVDRFDPQFFGILPRETQRLDPQQRLLLEVSWEALENAALAPDNLAGSNTGVFVGMSSSDYSHLQFHYGTGVDAYSGTGNAHSVAANRLSYNFDLKGPSLALDTACSSSLVAVHLASQSLKNGECDCAIVGGVNLMLSPELTETFALAGMMAKDGRCKTFDAAADGYVRGEGCGVIILKRLATAQQDGDRILAVIKGSAINQDGRSNGLTAPNGLSQQDVIRQALANAQIAPQDLGFIESHGTGTSLGDPIEVNSLQAVLRSPKSQSSPCYLGSLKTNIGHLEAAAGIAGLIKTVLCLQNQQIPANLHFNRLNPHIVLDEDAIAIPTQLQPWKSEGKPRFAGVSSFGFGGTNAHVILQSSELLAAKSTASRERPRHILTLSAKTEPALADLVSKYQQYLQANPQVSLGDLCFSANTGRTHFEQRLAIAVKSIAELKNKLASLTTSEPAKGIITGKIGKDNQNKIAFLFTGQGSQYLEMGYQLYQTQPIFRKALERCAIILKPYLDKPLLEVLYPQDFPQLKLKTSELRSLLDQTVYTQPAIFALEYALAQMWLSWGIKPDAVMGHSVGEYVAATIAGVFSLEDGLKLIAERGRLMQTLPQGGEMFAVLADETTVTAAIKSSSEVAIAAVNTHQSVVISGEKTAIAEVVGKLESQGIKTKQLNVSHAFHSPLMASILPNFKAIAETVTYSTPQIQLISNVTGTTATADIAKADYWVNHIVAPVEFAKGMASLRQEAINIFLEIGSKPTLLGMGRSILSADKEPHLQSPTWLPSLRPQKPDWQQISQSLAALYGKGIEINWAGFEHGYSRKKIALPTYPFQRQSYWLEARADKTDYSLNYALIEPKNTPKSPNFYQVEWQIHTDKLSTNSIQKREQETNPWLVFGDRQGLGRQIVRQLEKQNQTCRLIHRHDLDDSSHSWQQLLPDNQLSGIIYLWSLDDNSSNPTIEEINKYQQQNCTAILNLVQTLTSQSVTAPLWLVTRGARSIEQAIQAGAIASSCLWGLGNAIAIEHPECWGGIIDLPPQAEDNEASKIIKLIATAEKEDSMALRGDKIYVPRLVEIDNLPSKQLPIAEQNSYLITGGLGSLGLKVAQWLTEKGAKHLVLVGRGQPSEYAQQEINKLEQRGITVNVILADITDYDAVKGIFGNQESVETFHGTSVQEVRGNSNNLPPVSPSQIKGIIHAAGVLDDGLLQKQTWSRFQKVIAPKVIGAWNLHQATADLDLDFFVMFSSIASLIGSPGQSNYGVANAGLDAIARYRQSQNLPALSLNWGPWADGGMAVQQGFKLKGMNLIAPQQGLAALEKVLGNNLAQVGIISADWGQLSQQFPYLLQSNYFAPLLPESSSDGQNPTETEVFERLLAIPFSQRTTYLLNYLQQAIAKIAELEPENLSATDNLIDLGVDSLIVMETINQLKTDLRLMLYPREFYERPRIQSLAAYLAVEFTNTHDPSHEVKHSEISKPQERQNNLITATPRLAVTSSSPPLTSPIALILSSPRSGSTLLRVMLAGHPDLVSPPELHLLPFATMKERERELGIYQLGEGLKRAFMALKGISASESQQLVDELINQNLTVREVYQMLQQLAGDRLLVDKSPTYASDRTTLDRAESLFSNAKYIHLVRHPYSVIESFTRMRMDKLIGSGNSDPHQLAEQIWQNSNQNILNFAAEIDSSRYHLVRYEELVSQPQEVMRGICDFLEIPFNEAVLTPYQGDRMTDGVHHNAMSLGDPNFRNHQQIDAQLATNWRKIQLSSLLGNRTQQLARQLSYQLPQEASYGDELSLPMQEILLNIRGLRICLCTWGPEEGPIVLCLHGILEQGAAWSEVAIRLAQKGYRVIAPDLRGHGRSDRVGKGGSYNLIDFLADIDAIVENLAGKAFTLVGHSLGSVLGAIFTTIRPQRIKNIVLVETILPTYSDHEDTAEQLATQLDYLASPPEHPVFPNVEAAAQRLRRATPAISKSLAMLLAERITEPCEGGVRWRWEPLLRTRAGISFNGIGRSRYLKLLKKIKVPITLVYGDNSNLNRKEDLNKQHEAMPNAQRVVIPGGHNLPLEAPSALAKIISGAVALTNKLIP